MSRWSIPLVCLVLGGALGVYVAGPVLRGEDTTAAKATATAVPKELTSYRDVVKKVLPAVVSIEGRAKAIKAAKKSPKRKLPFDDSQVPEELRKFFEDMQDVPDNTPQPGFGSGFVVDPKGVILTNYHVVAGADQVQIELRDGRKFLSKDIHGDAKTDIAIVRINAKGTLPYLELGDSEAMEIGDRVLAVGAPFGLTGSVTAGIVSAKGRHNLQMNMYEDFLQTDAAINPGNSGGPLVNLQGQVIGINAAIKSRTGGFQGIGLAVASNLAKNTMDKLLKYGAVHRGYLGVRIGELTPEVADRLGLNGESGVVVGEIFDGAPAARAGIQAGDIITKVDGKTVKDGRELQTVVAGLPLGKPVSVDIIRDGKSKAVKVTIEEQPAAYGVETEAPPKAPEGKKESVSLDNIGAEVTELTPELAEQLGYKENASGVLVTKVDTEGPAREAGLTRGMLIVKVDNKPVRSVKEFRHAVEKGSLDKGLLLRVQTPRGTTGYLVLKAEAVK